MKKYLPIFTIAALAASLFVVSLIGCVAQPVTTGGATQPTTQPAKPTPDQVVTGAVQTVQTYGPVVQAILAAIPTTAPAAVYLGIALLVLNSLAKNFGGANIPKTQAQWIADIEAFGADLLPQLTPLLPGKTAAEVQTIVNVAKAAAAAQATK